MPLISSTKLLLKAQKGGYAIGAFNAENMEMIQAIVEAAEELSSPVIIQTTPSTVAYANVDMYRAMVNTVANDVSVPVVMHLDHGKSLDLCKQAIEAQYTSVMFDGSTLSFEENMLLTRKVVDTAKPKGIPVEAELGTVGGKEDDHEVSDKDALYTNPKQAKQFVDRTGVQSLAVAIGTAHGFYKQEPRLDFDRLKEIRKAIDIPLVLHGASGVSDESVMKSIQLGICKVNFATELRVAFTKGVNKVLEEAPNIYDPKKYCAAGRAEVKKLVKEKIIICGSKKKAQANAFIS
ncbi:class II fructose-1,6-bisphosphate aldolase [Iocasia frigidifontis]|uniref:Class II fructose-1,6-bisphosphate aldolase n=1 Tax=Iocasia fonsfrigidae TaxID=2682810 RepID=A0A8A7K7H5_9FIRM|nr:class II fructose-1,6-bisphosphate aldolase [Iocasia fonsfrigidae]QTL97733.1 class II fructose-1,6-bisphosphate aldolase [Iocasia fonsfrigidae]